MTHFKILFAALLGISYISPVLGKGLDCWLPSNKDGSELERLVVRVIDGKATAFQTKSVRSYQEASKGFRTVLFHQYSNPVAHIGENKYNREPPTSLLLLKSGTDLLEFAADVIVIDWGHGTLKSASPYNKEFNDRWKCQRID